MSNVDVRLKVKNIKIIIWSFAIFSYFFQFPFRSLTNLITPFLCLFLLLELPNVKIPKNKKYIAILLIYLSYLVLNSIYSIYNGISMDRIFRFLIILVIIPYCSLIEDKEFIYYEKIFKWIAVGKSVLLILVAIYMLIEGDHTMIRWWAIANDYGDIYLLNSIPKVQVVGNPLLVVAFIITVYRNIQAKKSKYLYFDSILILLGILAAGNFAYIVGLLLFLFYYMMILIIRLYKKRVLKKRYIISISMVLLIVLAPYIQNKIVEKSENSNVIRVEQAKVLLEANWIVGEGLGNKIVANIPNRQYNGNMYFELQTLYIFNQIGIVGLVLFYIITLFPFFKYPKTAIIFYIIYLFYTFWNPYCFDTTQMIATVSIINLLPKGDYRDEESDYYTIQSFAGKYKKCI